MPISQSVKKIVLLGTCLEIFSKHFDIKAKDEEIGDIRCQLADIKLKDKGRDIYDKKNYL